MDALILIRLWLYEESVGIDKWLKSCGDQYSMIMFIFMT